MRVALMWAALWLLAGCVPATVPPQLSYTPGAPVTVTEREYSAGGFQVRYPRGWRVITSAADAPLSVIFVSPTDDALLMVSTAPIGEDPPRPQVDEQTPLNTQRATLTLDNGVRLAFYAAAPASTWEQALSALETALESASVSP